MNYKLTGWIKILLLGVIFMTGCAHIKSSGENDLDPIADTPLPKTLSEVLSQEPSQRSASDAEGSVVVRNGRIIVQGKQLKNGQFDIPITINSKVEHWINYFCGRGRKYFTKYLERSEFFVPYIVPLLKQNGLPADLVYLAMIESGFNNFARSHAKAVGPWQFISATGRRYGLMVNWWVDERRDIQKSTLAAVGYLRDLYTLFQSWELAAAAYNAGEAKVARAIKRFGTKDFWVITQHRYLRPETRNYVPKIIAAAIISKNRSQFGFAEAPAKPGEDEAVAGDGEVVKVIKTDKPEDAREEDVRKEAPVEAVAIDEEDDDDDISPVALTSTNPISPNGAGEVAKLESPDDQEDDKDDKSDGQLAKPIPTPHVTKRGEVGGEELAEFEVQGPADLLRIARAAGLSYHTVKALNPEILRWCTPPRIKSYRIKLPVSVRDKFLATYNHEAFPKTIQFMAYRARSGDTLTRIARRFGIKVDPITDLNRSSARTPLRNGTKILLPLPNDRSRTFASLEVRDPPEKRRVRRARRNHKTFKVSYKNREAARAVRNKNKKVKG